jgi:hypothetical protein
VRDARKTKKQLSSPTEMRKKWSLILPRDAGKMELDFAQRCGKNGA